MLIADFTVFNKISVTYCTILIVCSQLPMPPLEVAVLLREILYPSAVVAFGAGSFISSRVPGQPLFFQFFIGDPPNTSLICIASSAASIRFTCSGVR